MVDRADQTVLTTGSNSGIGLVTVLEASRLGYRSVGSVCLRTESWKDVEAAGEAGHRVGSPYVRTYQRPAAGLRLSQPFMGRTRQVARVVGHALTARHPPDRHLVGIGAHALTWAQRPTPVPMGERVSRIGLGL